jgi:hypothetical protein
MTPEELLRQTSATNRAAHQQKQIQQQKIRSRQNPHAVALPYDGDRGLQQIKLSDGSIQEAQTNSNGVIGEGDTVALHQGKGRSRISVMPHKAYKKAQDAPQPVKQIVLYVADTENNAIRSVTVSGDRAKVITLAGSSLGHSGLVDGSGANARFYDPSGICVTRAGIIYVADTSNGKIRKLLSNGTTSTLSGTFAQPYSLTADDGGNLYLGSLGETAIFKIATDGTITEVIDLGTRSEGVRFAKDGFLYAVVGIGFSLYKINLDSGSGVKIYDRADGFSSAVFTPVYQNGRLYFGERDASSSAIYTRIVSIKTDGSDRQVILERPYSEIGDLTSVAFIKNNLYALSQSQSVLYKVVGSSLKAIAGAEGGFVDGVGTAAKFSGPTAIALKP